MTSTTSILSQARAFLTDPKNWHQGSAFPSATYKKPADEAPECMCAWMAVRWFASGCSYNSPNLAGPAFLLLDRATKLVTDRKFGCVIKYNDHIATKHSDILKVFDQAIELSKEEA